MNEQELQLAVIGYIMATKKQPKSEQEVQAIAQEVASMKQSNPQQYKQLVQIGQQAQQQQAGAKVAALGSKLNYIKKIKGLCPEGEELVYMKEGGRVCPVCQKKAEKALDGKKLSEKKNTISEFKEKRKAVNPNDTVHVGGKPKSLTNSDGSRVDKRYPAYTAKDYQNDKKTKDGQKRRMKADLVSSEKCGGKAKKAKKHLLGGPAEVMNQSLDLKTKLAPSTQFEFRITDPKKMMQWSENNRWDHINDGTNQEMYQKGLTRKVFPTDYEELDNIIKRGLESVEFQMNSKEARKNPRAFIEEAIRNSAGGADYADMAIKRFNTPGYKSTYDGQKYYTAQGQPIEGSDEDVAKMASNGRYIYDRKGQRLGF